jgi:hypothetical protein
MNKEKLDKAVAMEKRIDVLKNEIRRLNQICVRDCVDAPSLNSLCSDNFGSPDVIMSLEDAIIVCRYVSLSKTKELADLEYKWELL